MEDESDIVYIRSVQLSDFRSHEKFEMDFSPGVNLIGGRNGAGKSSILNAITLLFCATEKRAGVSTSLGEYVRQTDDGEGSPTMAKLSLVLNVPSYHPLYDESDGSVYLKRTIKKGKSASSTAELKCGSILLKKQTEIRSFLLQHFGIDFSTPIQMLSQDEMKVFSSLDEKTLFDFIYRASGLQEGHEQVERWKNYKPVYYKQIEACKYQIEKILIEKSELAEMVKKAENYEKTRNESLEFFAKYLYALALISLFEMKAVDDEKTRVTAEYEEYKANTPAIDPEVFHQRNQIIDVRNQIQSEITSNNQELARQKERLKSISVNQKQINTKIRELGHGKSRLQSDREDLLLRLETLLNSDLESQTRELNDHLRAEIENQSKIQSIISDCSHELQIQNQSCNQSQSNFDAISQEKRRLSGQINELNDKLSALQTKKLRLERTKEQFETRRSENSRPSRDDDVIWPFPIKSFNSAAHYLTSFFKDHMTIKNFLQKLHGSRHLFQKEVFGPIGVFFSAENSNLVTCISNALKPITSSFIVQTTHDFNVLSKLMNEFFRRTSKIVKLNFETNNPIDLPRNEFIEISANHDSVSRLHDVVVLNHDLSKLTPVYNYYCEQIRPHTIAVSSDPDLAKNFVESSVLNRAIGQIHCYSNEWRFTKNNYGSINSIPQRNSLEIQLSRDGASIESSNPSDSQASINQIDSEIRQLDVMIDNLRLEQSDLTNATSSLDPELEIAKREVAQIRSSISKINSQLQRHQEVERRIASKIRDLNTQLSALDYANTERSLTEIRSRISNIEEKISKAREDIVSLEDELNSSINEIPLLNDSIAEFSMKHSVLSNNLDENLEYLRSIENLIQEKEREIERYKIQGKKFESKLSELEDKCNELSVILQNQHQEFLNFAGKHPLLCNPDIQWDEIVQADLANEYLEEHKVKEKELESIARLGVVSLQEAKTNVEKLQMEIADKESPLPFLQHLFNENDKKQDDFVKYLVDKTGQIFASISYNFVRTIQSLRPNLTGDLTFSTKDRTLKIRVNTGGKFLSLTNISGGERAVATIAFLSALFESVPAPLHCIDEFDVFQDAQTRARSLFDLVSSGLQRRDGRLRYQTIIVSPNDLKIAPTAENSVFLNDPYFKNVVVQSPIR
ncbi:hypothetical protein RCL1_002177 [Eukaryota sp. TZLM3-RCL]